MRETRQILLCVAGMTPQVVTETLYVLVCEQKQKIDEVRVITTLAGRNKILNTLLDPAQGKFHQFCRDYQIPAGSLRFGERSIALLGLPDGRMLEDIRTVEDNECAANRISEVVRQLTRDHSVRLHASIAGGRKTMGIYLTAAMQLFGRTEDRLSHVLVSEQFESHPEFFYIPPEPQMLEFRGSGGIQRFSTAEAAIHLAEIPFIRLRSVASEWLERGGSYGDFVIRAQEDLDLAESAHELRLHPRLKQISIASRTAKLSKREFFIYSLLALARKHAWGREGFMAIEEIRREHLEETFRLITRARGDECGLEEAVSIARFKFLSVWAGQTGSRNKKDREDLRDSFIQARSRITKSLDTAGLMGRYGILSSGERGALRYGLSISPEKILFE